MPGPETSIVIRAFNEARHLPRLLDAIRHQVYQDFEIIVVDSGSTDLTREIARRGADKVIEIESRDFTFGFSLNTGIQHCRGRFVVVVSAHAFPESEDWLNALITPLRQHGVAMVYGRQVGAPESKFAEVREFRRLFGTRRVVHTPRNVFANNANSAVRKDLWERVPFDERLPGLEDIAWAKRWSEAGYDVVYEPAAVVCHVHEESWRQIWRRYHRESLAARWIGAKGRRHIPLELVSESAYMLRDIWSARHAGRPRDTVGEISRFRIYKAWGTIRGLLDGAAFANPGTREQMFFDKTYRAVVISAPGQASLRAMELPSVKPGDVLIKVAYEGVCGTDLEILTGSLGYYKNSRAKYPISPGHEFSGRVVKVGANVTGVEVGEGVVAECIQSCGTCDDCRRQNWTACRRRQETGVIGLNGGYAEYVLVPGSVVHRIPADLTLRQAALCEPLAVVLKGLKRLEAAWGPGSKRRCMVLGAGPIGYLCARVLDMRGHEVVVYDREPLRRACFENTSIGVCDELRDLSGFEALIDATGDPLVLDRMLHDSRAGATILLLGLPYARREYNFEDLVSYDKTIVGSVGSSAREFDEALQLLPRLKMDELLARSYSLEEFEAAWQAFRSRKYLKVLLEIDGRLDHAALPTR